MGNSSSKTPAFTPLPDRKPQVSAAQAAVPKDFHDIPERVLIHTTLGDITVGLFREQTPRVSHISLPMKAICLLRRGISHATTGICNHHIPYSQHEEKEK